MFNVSSSFNHTPAVQEPQNGFASATANSAAPATTPPIAQASGGRERLAAMPSSMKAQLLRSFDAQRAEINTQAGSSKGHHHHLNALDQLQKRDFNPAAGGMKIRLTPNSLVGGGKTASGSKEREKLTAEIGKKRLTIGAVQRDIGLREARGFDTSAQVTKKNELEAELTELQRKLSECAASSSSSEDYAPAA